MLICVGILIFGTEFCVGIFDRDGVTFFPIYDMFEATDVFVCLARSLACELSIIKDLVFDPTFHVLAEEEPRSLLARLNTLPPWFLLVATNHGNGVPLVLLSGPLFPLWVGRPTFGVSKSTL